MAPSFKLTYFHMLGRGEPIRMILSYGGIDFEDKRINRDDWELIKPTMPYGQVPVLEIDRKILTQTVPICRYLANLFHLAGKDNEENLKIDIAVEVVFDLLTAAYAFHMETDEARKNNFEKKLNLVLSTILPILDSNVKDNGGYIALDRSVLPPGWGTKIMEKKIIEGEDKFPNVQLQFFVNCTNKKVFGKWLREFENLTNSSYVINNMVIEDRELK